jgi:hypothetical protein
MRAAPPRSPRGVLTRPHRSTRRRAPAGVQFTVLCRLRSSFDGHNTVWGSPGNGFPEKCVTATKQAVETPGGGRTSGRTMNAPCHRRAASRNGGATSAERDGRPVDRESQCTATVWSVTGPGDRGPCPGTGGCTGPRRCLPPLTLPLSPKNAPCDERTIVAATATPSSEGTPRLASSLGVTWGRGTTGRLGPRPLPVAGGRVR